MRQSETKLAREIAARLLEGVKCELPACHEMAVVAAICNQGHPKAHAHPLCEGHRPKDPRAKNIVPIAEALHLLVKHER